MKRMTKEELEGRMGYTPGPEILALMELVNERLEWILPPAAEQTQDALGTPLEEPHSRMDRTDPPRPYGPGVTQQTERTKPAPYSDILGRVTVDRSKPGNIEVGFDLEADVKASEGDYPDLLDVADSITHNYTVPDGEYYMQVTLIPVNTVGTG